MGLTSTFSTFLSQGGKVSINNDNLELHIKLNSKELQSRFQPIHLSDVYHKPLGELNQEAKQL